MSQDKDKKVTLYVPCYNAERYLAECLQGILEQTYPIDEILAIDDGSTDRTAEIASRYPVKIIRHGVNKGLGAARNTAFNNAKNEYVAAVDADCVPEPDWLEALMANFEHDDIAGVGGKAIEKDMSSIVNRYKAIYSTQNLGDEWREATFLFGLNNIFRRSVVFEVGMFDERFRTNGEDVDICARIRRTQYRMVYEPKATTYHMRTDTLQSYLRAANKAFVGGHLAYLNNHQRRLWPIFAIWGILKKLLKATVKNIFIRKPHFVPISIMVAFSELRAFMEVVRRLREFKR